jgi:hypothetical protein
MAIAPDEDRICLVMKKPRQVDSGASVFPEMEMLLNEDHFFALHFIAGLHLV